VPGRETELVVDGSQDGIGAILSQKDPVLVGVQACASVMSALSVIDGVLLRGERLVVPKKLQEKVVEIAHEGYQGITKTKSYLRSRLWFPGMDIMTERIIRGCRLCQIATPQTVRMPLKMPPLPNETMEKVAADFYRPLPTGEYLLLVTCKYSRYQFIEVVNSTSARAVISKFEIILSNLGTTRRLWQIMDHRFDHRNSGIMRRSVDFK
jgi:hypothetical protein